MLGLQFQKPISLDLSNVNIIDDGYRKLHEQNALLKTSATVRLCLCESFWNQHAHTTTITSYTVSCPNVGQSISYSLSSDQNHLRNLLDTDGYSMDLELKELNSAAILHFSLISRFAYVAYILPVSLHGIDNTSLPVGHDRLLALAAMDQKQRPWRLRLP